MRSGIRCSLCELNCGRQFTGTGKMELSGPTQFGSTGYHARRRITQLVNGRKTTDWGGVLHYFARIRQHLGPDCIQSAVSYRTGKPCWFGCTEPLAPELLGNSLAARRGFPCAPADCYRSFTG